MSGATISRELFNLVNRLRPLERGKRYMVILTIPNEEDEGMDWTVTELGKIERANRGRAQDAVMVRVKP